MRQARILAGSVGPVVVVVVLPGFAGRAGDAASAEYPDRVGMFSVDGAREPVGHDGSLARGVRDKPSSLVAGYAAPGITGTATKVGV